MTRYAENTSVPSERTEGEIKKTLRKYGADEIVIGEKYSEGRVVLSFKLQNRVIRIELPLPILDEFEKTPQGRSRTESAIEREYTQAVRQRWRALLLVIKAKLEAVESGITTFEQEFLAHMVLPNRLTVGEWMIPQVDQAYELGNMPKLLLSGE